MTFEHIKNIYEHEKRKSLRKCYKLTHAHIYPNNFQRMKVSRAAQTLSNSVAMALEHYRTLEETKMKFKGN